MAVEDVDATSLMPLDTPILKVSRYGLRRGAVARMILLADSAHVIGLWRPVRDVAMQRSSATANCQPALLVRRTDGQPSARVQTTNSHEARNEAMSPLWKPESTSYKPNSRKRAPGNLLLYHCRTKIWHPLAGLHIRSRSHRRRTRPRPCAAKKPTMWTIL